MNNLKFNIKTSNNGDLQVPLIQGQVVFVLGANGVGKSTLMHNVYAQNKQFAKRILAHRRTWFNSNAMNMTTQQKRDVEQGIANTNMNIQSRWKDEYSEYKPSASIYDLINSENIRARDIAKAVDEDNFDSAKKMSHAQAPIQAINELLAISNIPIVISLENDQQLFASKDGSEPYSIAKLSDGERNALLIATDVLTSVPDSLIIIDEPERHLHRSIISPLLSSLFAKRKDCVFIISTHDVLLPFDNDNSKTLLLRSCKWHDKSIQSWDADLIMNNNELPDIVKKEILGSKRLGDCRQIEKAVDGINQTEGLHWLDAYGLVDADDRTPDQIRNLRKKGIIALPCYSVESLYYNIDIIRYVAKGYSKFIEKSEEELFNNATSKIAPSIIGHKERMCARLTERKVRKQVMSKLPKHQDIQGKGKFAISFDLGAFLAEEAQLFDSLVKDNDLNGLIERYPIRETPAIDEISGVFGFDRNTYEGVVRKLIINNPEIAKLFKTKLNELTTLIEK